MSSFLDFSQNDADDKSTKITPPSAKSAKEVQQTTIETEARRKFMAEVNVPAQRQKATQC